ncbi:MAG: helix-turn-helix domain-containing protein [Bryobacteraceae bacterium]
MPQPSNQPKLSPQQLNALQALAAGVSVSETARGTGIHRSTIYNWIRFIPEFRAALHLLKHEHAEQLQESLRGIGASAAQALRGLIENPDVNPSVRLRASLAVVDRVSAAQPSGFSAGKDTDRSLSYSQYDLNRALENAPPSPLTFSATAIPQLPAPVDPVEHNSTLFDTEQPVGSNEPASF